MLPIIHDVLVLVSRGAPMHLPGRGLAGRPERARSIDSYAAPMRKAASLLALLVAGPCLAWGSEGHRIVGTIASSDFTPATAAAVRELLGEETLADACCWADEVRSDHRYDWLKPLHYVNVPMGATAIDLARDGAGGEQVLGAIERFRTVLSDAAQPKERRAEALRLLLHLVGDVHQPMHVSYAADLGGNRLSVQSFGRKSNMHRVWDSDLIHQRLTGIKGGWATLSADLRKGMSEAQRKAWREATEPRTWADESLAITRRIYAEPPDARTGVDDGYAVKWTPVVEARLQAAGVRLAVLLNATLDPKGGTATKPEAQPPAGLSGAAARHGP